MGKNSHSECLQGDSGATATKTAEEAKRESDRKASEAAEAEIKEAKVYNI